ncbi:MAG: 30S ribosomal protein S17 [Myxococcales bacterium]|nr:30S ribosomal protein S17 [Myxococcales bacterium]
MTFTGDAADAASRHRRTMTGTVISTKMDKTAVVSVQRVFLHPKYRKYVRRRKHYMAHDEHGACQLGDFVLIEECRPMSKHKHWRFKQMVRRKAG